MCTETLKTRTPMLNQDNQGPPKSKTVVQTHLKLFFLIYHIHGTTCTGQVTWMREVVGLQGTAKNLRVQVLQRIYQLPSLQPIVAMQKLCCGLSTGFYLYAETSQILSSMKKARFLDSISLLT